MTDSDEVLQRLITQVRSGIDVVIDGGPAESRRLISLGCAAWAETADVITAVAPVGELSLSSLIAQVSGRPDFDGQDDAVLELGFKRLNVAERQTVLVLQAPQGMSRSALRYVQHVSRNAPGLVLVVLASPSLDALLEEPGFAVLRARLRVVPPMGVVNAAPLLLAAPAAVPIAPAPLRRRRLVWAISAVGVAAASAALAWVGHSSTLDDPAGDRRVHLAMPLEPAVTPPPALADLQSSASIKMAGIATVKLIPPAIAHAALLPRIVVAPSLQSRLALAEPAPSPMLPPLAPSHTVQPRRAEPPAREYSRLGRARQNWEPPQYQEPARYAWDQPYPAPPPPWAGRRRTDSPYLGTYAVDPYGMRVFRYDP